MTNALLDINEVAAKLRCHPQTARSLIRENEIPVQRRGRRVFAWEADVDAYLGRNYGLASDLE